MMSQKTAADQPSLFLRPKQPQTQMDRQPPKMAQSRKLRRRQHSLVAFRHRTCSRPNQVQQHMLAQLSVQWTLSDCSSTKECCATSSAALSSMLKQRSQVGTCLTPNWTSFLGLLYLRGVMNAKNFPVDLLWSDEYGCQAFRRAMPRNRFREIKRFIRFDCRTTRSERIKDDKFCMMSWVLTRFVENCQKSYMPDVSLTVDEQLFPTKA